MKQHLLVRRTEEYLEDLEQEVRGYCCAVDRIRKALTEYDANMKKIKKDRKIRPIVVKEYEKQLTRMLLNEVRRHSEVDDS